MISLSLKKTLKRKIKELDEVVFPNQPAPVKRVLKRPGWAPASYLTDTEDRRRAPDKEWYEVAILSQKGGDNFAQACHEVRHRVQRNDPSLELFTKDKLHRLGTRDKRIQKVLAYLDAIGEVPLIEEDAIIIERMIAYSENPNSTQLAKLWLTQEVGRVFLY